jgi:hypothetical protein
MEWKRAYSAPTQPDSPDSRVKATESALRKFERVSSLSQIEMDKTLALISRVASTSSDAKTSLTRMASTMSTAQTVRDGVGMFVAYFASYTGADLDKKISDAFAQFDSDGNKTLDKEEFRKASSSAPRHLPTAMLLTALNCDTAHTFIHKRACVRARAYVCVCRALAHEHGHRHVSDQTTASLHGLYGVN